MTFLFSFTDVHVRLVIVVRIDLLIYVITKWKQFVITKWLWEMVFTPHDSVFLLPSIWESIKSRLP